MFKYSIIDIVHIDIVYDMYILLLVRTVAISFNTIYKAVCMYYLFKDIPLPIENVYVEK